MDNYEIVMEPDLQLVPYLSYRKGNDTVIFNDHLGSSQLVGLRLKVQYKIVDSLGSEHTEIQSVRVIPKVTEENTKLAGQDEILAQEDIEEPK